jgi:hypothetical protein
VATAVARGFEDSAREPDPRDPRVMIAPLSDAPAHTGEREREFEAPARPAPQRPRADVPPSQHRPSRAPVLHPPGQRATRDFAAKAPRDFAAKAPRDFAAKAPRDFAAKAPREVTSKPAPDVPPKRPGRKIVVSAEPPRRGAKRK